MATAITKNFTLEEMSKTNHKDVPNIPDKQIICNLSVLCAKVLQPARDWRGKSIYVHSGYRCKTLNTKVGGVANSQHLIGQAADIDTLNIEENKKLFEWIRDNLVYDQLIDEKGYDWIHVSYNNVGTNRRQVLHLK